MCRLFGMTGGDEPVRATVWLLEAPDSLAAQSRREPDGTGLGIFDRRGRPVVHKQPIAAYEDQEFAREAREVESTTFVAHIRYASTGAVEAKNTHPFEQHGRLFAHNGVIGEPERIEDALGPARDLVAGNTDSERFFALVTKEIDGNGGDVEAGIVTAARWVAEHLPLFALNVILTTPHDLWALRYPETHELHVLERREGGVRGDRHFDGASAAGTVRVRCEHLARRPAVIVASEVMDENPHWTAMRPGELLHVRPDLGVEREIVLPEPPVRPLTLADLDPRAAASQHDPAREQA